MPLNIGVFTYSTKPRGSVVCAAALAEALGEIGHSVVLYALAKDSVGFFRPLSCPVELIPADPAPATTDALIRQRVSEVAHYVSQSPARHDVLHALDCLVANGLIESGIDIPIVRTVHHLDDFESEYLKTCQQSSIERAAQRISVSETTRRSVLASFGLDIPVIENGVSPMRFGPGDPARVGRLRQRFGIAANAPLILSVGGVERRKNTLRMLLGFADFATHHKEAHWLVVGGATIWDHSDYARGFLRALAALPLSIQRRVRLAGVLSEPELDAAYHSADVLLHAATLEGWGLSVLEAMASGTSVAVSEGVPFDEYLDSACATFVEPQSISSITQGLERAYQRKEQVRSAAVARAQRYSWRRTATRHAELYRALLGRHCSPGLGGQPTQMVH